MSAPAWVSSVRVSFVRVSFVRPTSDDGRTVSPGRWHRRGRAGVGRPVVNDIASAAIDKAEVLVSLRRYAEARAVLGAALAVVPDEPGAWCLLAQACLGDDRSMEALEAAERAVALAPDDGRGHLLRSLVHPRRVRPDLGVIRVKGSGAPLVPTGPSPCSLDPRGPD